MSNNVNKVRNIIKFIIINFPYQLTWFSMSKSFSNIKLSFLATKFKNKMFKVEVDSNPECCYLQSSALTSTPHTIQYKNNTMLT